MRRFVSALAAFTILAASATGASAQQTTTTPNGVPVTQARIGGSYDSFIGSANPRSVRTSTGLGVEAWTFYGTAGQCVEIVMRSVELDSALQLFDNPSFAPLLRQDYDSAGGRDARIEVILPKSGSYYVAAVAGIQGAPEGRYTLSIATCPPRPSADPAVGPDGRQWRARY